MPLANVKRTILQYFIMAHYSVATLSFITFYHRLLHWVSFVTVICTVAVTVNFKVNIVRSLNFLVNLFLITRRLAALK